jgi:hypothetical protein
LSFGWPLHRAFDQSKRRRSKAKMPFKGKEALKKFRITCPLKHCHISCITKYMMGWLNVGHQKLK